MKLNPKQDLQATLLFVIGSIGAFGQAYILRNELVGSYPYKMMAFPPASFYARIGNRGLLAAPVLAIAIPLFLRIAKPYLLATIPVCLCPVLFWLIFKMAYFFGGLEGQTRTGRNFDGTTADMVANEFAHEILSLMVVGAAIGMACGLIVPALGRLVKVADVKLPWESQRNAIGLR